MMTDTEKIERIRDLIKKCDRLLAEDRTGTRAGYEQVKAGYFDAIRFVATGSRYPGEKRGEDREITSTTYENAQRRLDREVAAWVGGGHR